MKFSAYALMGLLLGMADGGHYTPAPATPAVEFLSALPADTQATYITFQRSNPVDPRAYYWVMIWENGIDRTRELGPDVGYLGIPRYGLDSFNLRWAAGAGQCPPAYTWTGINRTAVAPTNPYCYVNLSATMRPDSTYDFGLYPGNAPIVRAHPGQTWTVWPNDHYSKVDLFRRPLQGVETGPAVRLDSITVAQGYLCLLKATSGATDTMEIVKLTGTTRTVLAKKAISNPWAAATLVPATCAAQGAIISMALAANTLIVTDASYRWGAPGLAQFRPVGSNVAYFDNWSGDSYNGTQTILIRVPPANPGQVRDYDVGVRLFDVRMGVWKRSTMSHIIWQRYNPPQSLPDTIKGAVVRLHVSANVPLFVDSVSVYYRVQNDTTGAVSPLYLLGRYPTRDTTINLPPLLRGLRYTFLASMKPTITGTVMGATRDTNLIAKLQVHWTSP